MQNLCTFFNTDEIHLELTINHGLGGICRSELMKPSWQHSAFTNLQSWFSHMCPSHQALQGRHEILHSAGSSQKLLQWTTKRCYEAKVLSTLQKVHYYSIIWWQCWQTWPVPRAGTPATPRQMGCLHCIPPVLASLCLSSVFHFSPLPPILLTYLEGWKVSAGFLVSAAGSRVIFVTCSREQARSRKPRRASSQEVEF